MTRSAVSCGAAIWRGQRISESACFLDALQQTRRGWPMTPVRQHHDAISYTQGEPWRVFTRISKSCLPLSLRHRVCASKEAAFAKIDVLLVLSA